jgi:nitrogen fixation NifU-like protein
MLDSQAQLYQQVILDHNKNPRNYGDLESATHKAEGYNPLCGDHLNVFLILNDNDVIESIHFSGDGCAISKASASMMTEAIKGKIKEEAIEIFTEFNRLLKGELDPKKEKHNLGKLAIFSGIWHFPSRVKCASLSWHTMKGALNENNAISTE